MNKHEIYEALKSDGAKLPKAERFMNPDELKSIYAERFGTSPDEPVKRVEVTTTVPIPVAMVPGQAKCEEEDCSGEIHLLRFTESGWCPALNRSYTRGLYRPKTFAEYKALKPYAEEVE